jgi:Cu(I)/Ag(I) efflux system protein CusF
MKTPMLAAGIMAAAICASSFAADQSMDPSMPGMQHDARQAEAQGHGTVKAIDVAKGTITLQHDPIASIGWPAMTMPFKVASPDLLKAAKVGDRVQFTVRPAGMASTVTSIKPVQP